MRDTMPRYVARGAERPILRGMSAHLEILTLPELAEALRVPVSDAARLVEQTELPRFTLGGELRFLAASVLAWLERQEGRELLPTPSAEPAVRPHAAPVAALPPAPVGELPFVTVEALDALGAGATDPARNLDRLTLRDALLELNEALLPVLGHLSHGELHPHHDEKSRTSPWRLDDAPRRRINALSMAWGAGDGPPPGFVDRPRIEVELATGELRIALLAPRGFVPPLSEAELDALREAGLALDEDGAAPTFAKVYPLGHPAPTLSAVSRALEADLRVLVPVWVRGR